MKVILLAEKNVSLIAKASNGPYQLTEDEVRTRINIPNLVNPDEKVYFIPRFIAADGRDTIGWATIPEQHFLENYDADMSRIDNEFVEVHHKKNIMKEEIELDRDALLDADDAFMKAQLANETKANSVKAAIIAYLKALSNPKSVDLFHE